jgi:hypothetical protein
MSTEELLEKGGEPCWAGMSIATASEHANAWVANHTFQNSEALAFRILTARSTDNNCHSDLMGILDITPRSE